MCIRDRSPSCSGNYLAAHFNFNASTSRFHIEQDTSYTLMLVPWGCSQDNLQLQSTVMIGMRAGVTFTFAAYLLTHRQHCSASDYDCCLNCSTYTANEESLIRIKFANRDVSGSGISNLVKSQIGDLPRLGNFLLVSMKVLQSDYCGPDWRFLYQNSS